ncbi:MAG: hypothetical protein HYY76_11495 [Acidobacteria bacterium]|nr:hypothetical protein [Acidobacteriota bacterium]
MRLVKRNKTSGSIATMIDTDAFTAEERELLSDELHELLIESKCGEAVAVTKRGVDAQIEYLIRQRGEDAVVDSVLDALDAVDQRRVWANRPEGRAE